VITDILFDFFGTLVQYVPGAFHTAPYQLTHRFLQQHGFPIAYDTFVETFTSVSNDLEAQAKRTLCEYHMHDVGRNFFQVGFATDIADSILAPFIAQFIAEWSRGIVYLDAIEPFIAQLAARYRLSIISNTHYPALIHDHVAAMQIGSHFAQIITSVEVSVRKPHSAIFEHALAELQIAPHQAIYVGDTYLDDYQGATSAHLHCALLDPQQLYPQVPQRLESLFDLVPYLEQLQSCNSIKVQTNLDADNRA
jgi:HAD superfamily hydrolase (TIGR01549 family)